MAAVPLTLGVVLPPVLPKQRHRPHVPAFQQLCGDEKNTERPCLITKLEAEAVAMPPALQQLGGSTTVHN